jgi:hypothetical protein
MWAVLFSAILVGSVGAIPHNHKQNFPQCDATYPDLEPCKEPCEAANDCFCFGKEPPVPLKERPQVKNFLTLK